MLSATLKTGLSDYEIGRKDSRAAPQEEERSIFERSGCFPRCRRWSGDEFLR